MATISRALAFFFFISCLPLFAQEELSPCQKFRDASNEQEAENNYVLYRNLLKKDEWDKALTCWRKVYHDAPAADGRRNTVYTDGVRFYEYLISQSPEDTARLNAYIDTIFMLYDEASYCYPRGEYYKVLKGYNLYFKYKHRAGKTEVFQLFNEALDPDDLSTAELVFNPLAILLAELHKEGQIDDATARQCIDRLLPALEHALRNCRGRQCERLESVEYTVSQKIQYFESVKGFFPCSYFMEKYYPEFESNPKDFNVVRNAYTRIKLAGGCTVDTPEFRELESTYKKLAKAEFDKTYSIKCPPPSFTRHLDTLKKFEEAFQTEPDSVKKAGYALTIAKMYNVHLRNPPRSREWALRAADYRPGWGEPYIWIGSLYAHSGSLCGAGRDWSAVRVVLPAIDMWEKARAVDPSAAPEADKWIGRYRQQLPTVEMINAQGLQAGDSYFVNCWIQETTTVRAREEE
ncbi:MAG: hypothetical protein J5I98_36000 [Phaeodactylibacter sp.]|nr:hypothetical protein [Phaeodactylibacter sp.]